eukprot:8438789-Pyramimonas_sp.AAC.1
MPSDAVRECVLVYFGALGKMEVDKVRQLVRWEYYSSVSLVGPLPTGREFEIPTNQSRGPISMNLLSL